MPLSKKTIEISGAHLHALRLAYQHNIIMSCKLGFGFACNILSLSIATQLERIGCE